MGKKLLLLTMMLATFWHLSYSQSVVVYKDGNVKGVLPFNNIDSIVFTKDIPTVDDDMVVLDPWSGDMLAKVLQLVASGANNVDMTNGGKLNDLLSGVETANPVIINGNSQNILSPCITIIDDDTVDDQIPSSRGLSTVTGDGIGYFSVLLPFVLSLQTKHHVDVKIGLAAEGHRIGLTPMGRSTDNYELNENGLLLKKLNEKMGWEILNHSMTAQLPTKTFGVESLNSELANQILREGSFVSKYNFQNTIVLDKSTGKWYEVNMDKTSWVERVPAKKYAMLYYRDYGTNDYHINRDFDFDYSWGEWFRRADELGLPVVKGIVFNGSSTSPFTISNSRKYADFCIRTHMNVSNKVPIPAAVARYTVIGSSANNVEVESYRTKMMSAVDYCLKNKTWLVFMSHSHEASLYNGYKAAYTYSSNINPSDYPKEWVIPLKREEILTMDENNYWATPPSRLGISSWAEWYPAPGTQLATFYDVLEYAIGKGIRIVLPTEGWRLHGNKLQLGVDMNGTSSPYNIVDEYTNEEQSYITVGVDGTIRYYKK